MEKQSDPFERDESIDPSSQETDIKGSLIELTIKNLKNENNN